MNLKYLWVYSFHLLVQVPILFASAILGLNHPEVSGGGNEVHVGNRRQTEVTLSLAPNRVQTGQTTIHHSADGVVPPYDLGFTSCLSPKRIDFK